MKRAHSLIISMFLFFCSANVLAQLPQFKVVFGRILIDDGTMNPHTNEEEYRTVTDSLDKNLKIKPNDTTSLFYRSLFYLSFNSAIAKPYQNTKGALENLTIAKNLAEKAIALNMKSFNLKVLRVQIYNELSYRFTGDESWQFNAKQIESRRKLFNTYKELTNKYYDELAVLDKNNAYDYQKLKFKGNYPL